ncbi:MAG: GNAT family N-acetyltransferase [Endomicrobiia bacterium]
MIMIRKSNFDDKKDFAELVLLSAPFLPILFSERIKDILQELFCYRSNLFSFEHVLFADIYGEKAGMILGYNWQTKTRESLRIGFFLFKKIGFSILRKLSLLIKFNSTVGKLNNGEYYISNIATYPEFRGFGVGKRLMFETEHKAKMVGAEKIVLDVEKDNIGAITFYKKLGYETLKEFSISLQKNKILYFNRMTKEVR